MRTAITQTAPAYATLDRALAFLTPIFLPASAGDAARARLAASQSLASYDARNDTEIRLAALIVAFGFGALDAMSRSMDPALSINQLLRLRGNAVTLSRASHRADITLAAMRKADTRAAPAPAPASDPAPEPDPASDPGLPLTTDPADLLAFVRAAAAAQRQHIPATATPTAPQATAPQATAPAAPLSRQQRRLAERKAEKTRRRQQEQARLAERSAARAC